MAGTCVATTSRTASVTTGDLVITFTNPVLDSDAAFAGQPATASDADPCLRFGVRVQQTWHFPFDRGSPALDVRSVARFNHAKGSVGAPLIVLNPHGCGVLTATGNAQISAVTSAGLPAYIAVDSDGNGCGSGGKVIVDAVGNAQLEAGVIAMWALAIGNTSRAYDPSDVGPGRAFDPIPIALSAPVTRTPMDWRYNCLVSNGCPSGNPSSIADLVAADGAGVPAGYTRWTTLYSCSPGTTNVPRGNWYVDCPGGLSTNGTLTFRGGNIVSDGPFNVSGNGNLRINCDVATSTAACPSDPTTTTNFFIRNGGLGKAGNVSVTMLETFVYLANGTINMAGNSQLNWTAPQDPSSPFNNLLVWTESTDDVAMNGNADTVLQGIFFAPNATMTLTGNTGTQALESQIFINNVALVGNTDLTLAPHDDRMLALGGAGSVLIR
jgi:hypothetical protein